MTLTLSVFPERGTTCEEGCPQPSEESEQPWQHQRAKGGQTAGSPPQGRDRRLRALVRTTPTTLDAALIALGFLVSPASAMSNFGQKFSSALYMNTCIGFIGRVFTDYLS